MKICNKGSDEGYQCSNRIYRVGHCWHSLGDEPGS